MSMTERFDEKLVIVTGGSRGIGFSACQEFVNEGAQVVMVSQDLNRGEKAREEIIEAIGKFDFIQADVTDKVVVFEMVNEISKEYGRIDVLVNNAGIHESAPFLVEDEELWTRLYRVNVLGSIFISQAVVSNMLNHNSGAIVHIASKAGVVGEPGHVAYSASKGAVISMTRAMAVDLAPFGIRVNAVCPGPVFTDMLYEAVPEKVNLQKLADQAPLGRIGEPRDIARSILYLASDDADWCTGQCLSVDGGLSILK
jgi:NAD(P)-dependent dehydrogenase (short-subunit alcohol dehydrogenase family)